MKLNVGILTYMAQASSCGSATGEPPNDVQMRKLKPHMCSQTTKHMHANFKKSHRKLRSFVSTGSFPVSAELQWPYTQADTAKRNHKPSARKCSTFKEVGSASM